MQPQSRLTSPQVSSVWIGRRRSVDERPVIVAVDDEADALSAMRDALTRRFATDYRIASHLSARAALDEVCAIKEKGGEKIGHLRGQEAPEPAHALDFAHLVGDTLFQIGV